MALKQLSTWLMDQMNITLAKKLIIWKSDHSNNFFFLILTIYWPVANYKRWMLAKLKIILVKKIENIQQYWSISGQNQLVFPLFDDAHDSRRNAFKLNHRSVPLNALEHWTQFALIKVHEVLFNRNVIKRGVDLIRPKELYTLPDASVHL